MQDTKDSPENEPANPLEDSQRSWWQFRNPFKRIDFNTFLDEIWSGVILGDSHYNPDKSCYELAEEYQRNGHNVEENVKNFIQWQTTKAGMVGFALGAPGLVTLAAAIPGDLITCAYLQMRTVAVVGLLCGWDVKSDQIKTAALYAMAGGNLTGGAASAGARMGASQSKVALKSLPAWVLTAINKKLGYRFVTKFGTQGVINLVDFVPIVGGVIGGAINALLTYKSGCVAYGILRNGPEKDGPEPDIVIDGDPLYRRADVMTRM